MLTRQAARSSQPAQYLVDTVPVTPSFFTALRIALLRGRFFTADDGAARTPVMMLSARTARRLFGDRDPIGRSVPLAGTYVAMDVAGKNPGNPDRSTPIDLKRLPPQGE
jgi:hypothetical protein